jgi:hypothetical protein
MFLYHQISYKNKNIYQKNYLKACPESSRTSEIKAKSKKNRVKKHVFLVFVFTFSLIEANATCDQIYTFFIFGVHVVKKNIIFYTFFGIFFHFPPHFTKQKMHNKFKKSAFFWHFALHYSTKKVFFNIFFTFF